MINQRLGRLSPLALRLILIPSALAVIGTIAYGIYLFCR